MMKAVSIKMRLIIFLSIFAILLSVKDKDALFLFNIILAVVSAVAINSLIQYLLTRKFTFSESSIISGLIIGYVLSNDERWWVFLIASFFAIASKNFLRIHKKHIFNPAAFGILAVIILFNAYTQWKGTYLWYVLLPLGAYFAYKIRKLEILLSYFLVSLAFFAGQAIIQKTPFLNIFWYLSYFFIFVMLIEPKTSPIHPAGKYIFGSLVASLIFIFTQFGVRLDAELLSLLAVNSLVPMLNKLTKGG
jgi:Na+-translocating ferredoxin:NAD+ oxidoreductase RnfD subunit